MLEKSNSIQIKGELVPDAVTLIVDGQVYAGWEEVSISKEINSLASSFSLNLTDRWRPQQTVVSFKVGDTCEIYIGKKSVLSGYIDTFSRSISANSRTMQVSGRSKSGDLVDCSYDGKTEFKNSTMKSITEKIISPFGITASFLSDGGSFPKIDIKQGESIAEIIDRMARQKGLLVYASEDGGIVFSKRGSERSSNEIIQGVNLLTGSVSHDMKNRFSTYKVKGQTSGTVGTAENATKNTASSTDEGIERYRPMVIIAENSVNQAGALNRANYESSYRAAKGSSYSVSVQGWFQENGDLWDINKTTALKSSFLGYQGDLLINSVTYSKGSNGTICSMELIRPDAYLFEPTVSKAKDVSKIVGGVDEK